MLVRSRVTKVKRDCKYDKRILNNEDRYSSNALHIGIVVKKTIQR